jgi:hypothetical protein
MKKLVTPVKCTRTDAWLGEGYYFWDDILDAHLWGKTSKRRLNNYDIYSATIKSENILDTVFNEDEYRFWITQIEKAAKKIISKTSQKPTIKEVNEYFSEKANWGDYISGILFQDIPRNDEHLLVSGLFYRKRIQFACFDLKIINNFALDCKNEPC